MRPQPGGARGHVAQPGGRLPAALVVGLLALALAVPTPVLADVRPGGGEAVDDAEAATWRTLLRRAADAASRRRHTGETIWVVWTDDGPRISLSQIRRGRRELVVSAAGRYTVRLDAAGGSLVDHEQGWLAPLMAVEDGNGAPAGIGRKYAVRTAGTGRVLGRPCARLEIRRRADDSLRERLCVDEATGLLVRRESFEGANRRVRLFSYLTLDLGLDTPVARPSRGRAAVRRRDQSAHPVDPGSLDDLRAAGWIVPDRLPGGYEPVGAYTIDGVAGRPLQIVYHDGLYTVSLFQQRGRPDWASLPDGARPSDRLAPPAYEWPGAVPQRLVWAAGGAAFALVGDAPPGEFTTIADALPHPPAPGSVDRVRRGLGRLWRWVSPWGED